MISLKEFRQQLHQHPELSEKERETQARLRSELEALQPDCLFAVAETGLVAGFKGPEGGPKLLLRADIDALPITEANTDLSYTSQNPNVSHKCGHDGHSAIMLGVGRQLADKRPSKGWVYLLFQPAEEIGLGAQKVLEDPAFQKIDYDAAFALHNLPGFPLAQVMWREGAFTPGVKSVAYKLTGRESHAAEPEKGRNPAVALAEILALSPQYSQASVGDEDYALLTPVHALLGEKAYGVSPGYGEAHFTLRCSAGALLLEKQESLDQTVAAIAAKHDLSLEREWSQEFWPNHNHPAAVELLRACAQKAELESEELEQALPWGEDFGLFIKDKPGALFGLGAGEDCPPLHDAHYDFPDAIIEAGCRLFSTLAYTYCDGEYQLD